MFRLVLGGYSTLFFRGPRGQLQLQLEDGLGLPGLHRQSAVPAHLHPEEALARARLTGPPDWRGGGGDIYIYIYIYIYVCMYLYYIFVYHVYIMCIHIYIYIYIYI